MRWRRRWHARQRRADAAPQNERCRSPWSDGYHCDHWYDGEPCHHCGQGRTLGECDGCGTLTRSGKHQPNCPKHGRK